MLIRTGILTLPAPDDDAVWQVRRRLAATAPGVVVVQESAAPDERNWLAELLTRWCDETELDLVITIGGVAPAPGPSAAESIPAAMADIVERPVPGAADAMRRHAAQQSRLALLQRADAGIRGRTLIVNLPAGASAGLFLEGCLDLIAPLIDLLHGRPAALGLTGGASQEAAGEAAESGAETAASDEPSAGGKIHGLDPGEFAAFLRRAKDR